MHRLALPALILLSACAKTPDGTDPDVTPSPLTGVWEITDPSALSFGPDPVARILELTDDGSGSLTYAYDDSDVLGCLQLRWEGLGDSLVLDFEPGEYSLYLLDGLWGAEVDGDTLTLTNDLGTQAVMTAIEAAPTSLTCATLSVTDEITDLPEEYSRTGLIYVPSSDMLMYGRSNPAQLYPVPLSGSGGMVMPVDMSASNLKRVHAYHTDAFWLLDDSNQHHIVCRTPADADCGTLDTTTIGHELDLDAATATPGHLWLHGRNGDGDREFILVDTVWPTVNRTVPFNHEVEALAWDGESMWALVAGGAPVIVRVDMDTGNALETYRVPGFHPLLFAHQALAWADDSLWLLGENNFEGYEGVSIVALQPD